jgi:hypothetical protein
MKLLRKTWFKILISLIAGGAITEIIHISTGDPNRPKEFNPSLFIAIAIYFIITIGIYLFDGFKARS